MLFDQIRAVSPRNLFDVLTETAVVIQGTADKDTSGGRLTHNEVIKTEDLCLNAFKETSAGERENVFEKLKAINNAISTDPKDKQNLGNVE